MIGAKEAWRRIKIQGVLENSVHQGLLERLESPQPLLQESGDDWRVLATHKKRMK